MSLKNSLQSFIWGKPTSAQQKYDDLAVRIAEAEMQKNYAAETEDLPVCTCCADNTNCCNVCCEQNCHDEPESPVEEAEGCEEAEEIFEDVGQADVTVKFKDSTPNVKFQVTGYIEKSPHGYYDVFKADEILEGMMQGPFLRVGNIWHATSNIKKITGKFAPLIVQVDAD